VIQKIWKFVQNFYILLQTRIPIFRAIAWKIKIFTFWSIKIWPCFLKRPISRKRVVSEDQNPTTSPIQLIKKCFCYILGEKFPKSIKNWKSYAHLNSRSKFRYRNTCWNIYKKSSCGPIALIFYNQSIYQYRMLHKKFRPISWKIKKIPLAQRFYQMYIMAQPWKFYN
jgi:hypothetical protein